MKGEVCYIPIQVHFSEMMSTFLTVNLKKKKKSEYT